MLIVGNGVAVPKQKPTEEHQFLLFIVRVFLKELTKKTVKSRAFEAKALSQKAGSNSEPSENTLASEQVN